MAHNAHLFDRQCPTCHKMLSSFEHRACPQCEGDLDFIRTPKGIKMSITEGTLYPNFNDAVRQKNAEDMRARKGAVPIIYRFKAFSFADSDGALAPPEDFHRLVKGALVSVRMYNHELLATPFQKRNGDTGVELMVQVFPQFGDVVAIRKDGKAAEHQVDDPGTRAAAESAPTSPASATASAPNSAQNDEVAAMRREVAELKALILEREKAKASNVNTNAPVDPTPKMEVPGMDDEDFDCMEGVVIVT
jgi:hypothetical protein